MASVDQRVVELKFDAKHFQQGIQAAIASLDNLKKNLNMNKAADEFDKVEKASKNVTFKELYSSVDTISNRFSTLGIIGMSALNQITTAAMQTGKRLLSALTAPLIEGGKRRALNIEQAKFQIQGLGYTWEQVEKDINYGVKDTAYGLDAAAKAASQLLASQVKVGSEMKTSLRAISGVAAMTGSEYEDIANIFTTVAGNGRLMGDQLLQISTRGLNAAATLGEYLHKSESEVRDMVSKGQIDFKTFAAAMDSAFGEHAKKANETFTGSLSNMKAALSRIGAEFASPAYTNLRDVFNSLTPVIDGVKVALAPLIETAKKGMKYLTDFATKTLNSFGGKEGVAGKLEPVMQKLNRIVEAFGSLMLGVARLIKGIVVPIISAFGEVLGGPLLDGLAGAIEVLSEFVNSLVLTDRMSANLKKSFVGIFTVINALFQMISAVVSLVSTTLFSVFSGTFGFVADVILAITGYLGDIILRFRDLIVQASKLQTVQDILSGISKIFNTIKSALSKVYNAFRSFAGVVIDKAFEKALSIFDNMASIILTVGSYIDKAIAKMKEFIKQIKSLPAVQNFLSTVKTTFDNIRESVGSTASNLKTNFVTAFEAAKQVVGEFVGRLRELIEQYVELPTLQDVVTSVAEFMTKAFEKIVEIFDKAKEVLTVVFNQIKKLNKISLQGILDSFAQLRDRILEVINLSDRLAWLNNIFGGIKEGAAQAAQGTANTLDLIKQKLVEFVEWAKGKFSQITMGDAIAAGIGGTFIVFLVQLTKFISTADKLTATLKKGIDIFDKLGNSITGVFDSFSKINKAKANAIKMDAISNLIKSVVLLAGAVALLASMDIQRVAVSAGVLLVLAGGLIGLSAAMNAISAKTDPATIAETATQLIAASGSILILAAALKLLSTIPVDKIISSLVAITIMMGEMLGFMIVVGKVAPKASKEAVSMLLVAGSLLILAKAMTQIGAIKPADIFKSIGVITALIAGLAIMFKIARRVAITKKGIIGIVAIVGALYLLIHAMKMLANLDANTVSSGLSRMISLMGVLSILLIATKLAGQHATKAGAAILLISVAMNIMALAIKQMASIDDATLEQATKSINEMLKIFALITLMTKFAGKEATNAGFAIIEMAAAIAVIAGAIFLLTRLSDEDLKRGTRAITTILGMFAIIVAATGLSKACQKTLKQMAICLGLLVAAIAVLSLIEPANLLSASAAVSMLMFTFALVLAAAGVGQKSMAAVWQLVGVVGVLALLLAMLADLHAENALMAATAMSELMVVMGGLLIAMSKLKVDKINIAAAAELALAIDAMIAIIGALVVAVGALNTYVPEFEQFLTAGIPIMQKIGQAIGEFVGGIIGGIAAGASAGLITLAENLNKFVQTLQPFLEAMSNIDDSVIDGAKKLVELMLLFAVADLINALSFWYDGKSAIESLSEGLPLLGKAMRDFSESLKGTDLAAMAIGAQAAKSLAEVGLLMSEGGLKGLILGSTSEGMKGLSENLKPLGTALKDYGEEVKDVNAEAINRSVKPMKSLIEVTKLVNGEGGLLQVLGGSTDVAVKGLTENLKPLGTALKAYGDEVADLNAEAVNNSVQPMKSLIEISNMINGEGGLLQVLGGSNDVAIKGLTENLKPLATALKDYSKEVSDLNAEAVNNSVQPMKSLIEISNMINGEAGFFQVFGGSNDRGIKALTANLPELGSALKSYGDNLKGANLTAIKSSVEPMRSLVEISNMIDSEGGAQSWIFGSSSGAVTAFKDNLPLLGEALASYSDKVTDINSGAIDTSVNCLKTIIDALNSVNDGVSAIFGGGTGSSINILKDNLPSLSEALKSYSENVGDLNVDGINSSVETLKKIVDAVSGASDQTETFRNLGLNIKSFGEAFRDSTNILGGINYESVDSAIEALNKIKDAADRFGEGFPGLAMKLQEFVNALKVAAESGVSAFVQEFESGSLKAGTVVTAMIDQMINLLQGHNEQFRAQGNNLMTAFVNGVRTGSNSASLVFNNVLTQLSNSISKNGANFKSKAIALMNSLSMGIKSGSTLVVSSLDNIIKKLISNLTTKASTFKSKGRSISTNIASGITNGASAITSALNTVLSTLSNKLSSQQAVFRSRGKGLSTAVANGIKSGASTISSALNTVLSGLTTKIRNKYNGVYEAGKWLMIGLKNGIRDNAHRPVDEAGIVAHKVLNKLNKTSEIGSPSRATMRTGKWLSMGLAIGIVKYSSQAIKAAGKLGDDVKTEVKTATNNLSLFDNIDPVITPTVDMSNVDKAISSMNSGFSSVNPIPIRMQGAYASSAFSNMSTKALQDAELQNGSPKQVINNYDLTQNNYSPKALSRIDIYRDTRNQFTRLKEVVNA